MGWGLAKVGKELEVRGMVVGGTIPEGGRRKRKRQR